MTIPTGLAWPLGCLALLGLVVAVFTIGDWLYRIVRAVSRWWSRVGRAIDDARDARDAERRTWK